MALPYYTALWTRYEANHHLQVEIVERGPVSETFAHVPTRFRVARVFKSDCALSVGTELSLRVKVCASGREPQPGLGGWLPEDQYLRGRYYEVYLVDKDDSGHHPRTPAPDYYIAMGGAEIHPIDKPTESATVKCPTREEAEAEEARFHTL
jgi:hypothetical protein